MNINLEIGINLSEINNPTGDPIGTAVVSQSFDLLLSPMYATERDVLRIFMEDDDIYKALATEIIFEASMKADSLFDGISALEGMTPQQIVMYKREYTVCYSVYMFSLSFFKDYLKSVKKSKFLSDVKVTLDIEKDPSLIKAITHDAKECAEELASIGHAGSGQMGSFLRGRMNTCNKRSSRHWLPNLGGGYPHIPIAEGKYATLCRAYKAGPK